jgi:hypothetical protein
MPLAFDKGSSVLSPDLCGSGAHTVKKAVCGVSDATSWPGLVRGRARF